MHIQCKLKLAEYNKWYLKKLHQNSVIEDAGAFVITDEDADEYYVQEDTRIAPISTWIPKKFVEIVEE